MSMTRIFIFFSHENFFKPIWSIRFLQLMFLYFDILTLSPTLSLVSLSLFIFSYIYQYLHLYFFLHLSQCIYFTLSFLLYDSNKSFSNTRFYFNMCWIYFYIIALEPLFRWCIVKSATFNHPYFASLVPRLIQNFLKRVGNCNTFSFL